MVNKGSRTLVLQNEADIAVISVVALVEGRYILLPQYFILFPQSFCLKFYVFSGCIISKHDRCLMIDISYNKIRYM